MITSLSNMLTLKIKQIRWKLSKNNSVKCQTNRLTIDAQAFFALSILRHAMVTRYPLAHSCSAV